MRITRKIFAVCIMAVASGLMHAAGTFNSNMDAGNMTLLESGKMVIRNTSFKKLSLNPSNETAKKILGEIEELSPSYFAEIIQFYPYTEGEDFIGRFDSLVTDVPSYAGIPYYSERHEKWYDLYSSAKIIAKAQSGNRTYTVAELLMKPFGTFSADIISEKDDESYFYKLQNTSDLSYYDKFDCIDSRKMKSMIVIFHDGDHWVLYGVGCARAPSIFFLRERIEISFMNRIKTFCTYFFNKL